MPRAIGIVRLQALAVIATLGASALSAQPRARVSGSLETGAAAIEQPLVQSGAAYYLSPGAQLTAHDFTVGGDAVFAAGSPVWKSFLGSAYVRAPAFRSVRLIGSGQLLKTTGLLPTLHGDLGAEWRGGSNATTLVARARAGQLRYADEGWRDLELAVSAAHSRGSMLFAADAVLADARRPDALRQQIGFVPLADAASGVQTLDITPRMIWERGRLRTDASLALRMVERGVTGTRIGPQLSFTVQMARGFSLFAGGAQRLPDARAGVPSGRTALLGMRLSGAQLLRRPAPVRRSGPSLMIVNGVLMLEAGNVSTERASLRGDFTEWQARECHRSGRRRFACGAAPRAGTWRVAVRLNDGPWQQPGNLASAADDFGSVDGVLMTGGKP
jgi:hypothetical protein